MKPKHSNEQADVATYLDMYEDYLYITTIDIRVFDTIGRNVVI